MASPTAMMTTRTNHAQIARHWWVALQRAAARDGGEGVGCDGLLGSARELLASGEDAVGYLLEDRVGDVSDLVVGELFVSEKAEAKHTTKIFTKLHLPIAPDDNHRVLAVLAWLKV